MSDLPHVIVGQPLSEEHTRVFEAYLREHNAPMAGHRRVPTAAEVNQAVDWWNALEPEPEPEAVEGPMPHRESPQAMAEVRRAVRGVGQ